MGDHFRHGDGGHLRHGGGGHFGHDDGRFHHGGRRFSDYVYPYPYTPLYNYYGGYGYDDSDYYNYNYDYPENPCFCQDAQVVEEARQNGKPVYCYPGERCGTCAYCADCNINYNAYY